MKSLFDYDLSGLIPGVFYRFAFFRLEQNKNRKEKDILIIPPNDFALEIILALVYLLI